MTNLDWMTDGLCRQVDPELMFPEKGASPRQAKTVCMACDVRVACLEYAVTNAEPFGVWGGLSEMERRSVRARRQAVAA